ncbi:hypothetical protein STEG23_020073 [Scotinomys teguina]
MKDEINPGGFCHISIEGFQETMSLKKRSGVYTGPRALVLSHRSSVRQGPGPQYQQLAVRQQPWILKTLAESGNNPDVSQLKNGLRKCGTYSQWSIAPQRKNNTNMKFADKWKELENIILSEETQAQKDKHEFSWNADTIYTSCLPSGHSAFYSTVNQSNTFTSYRAISTADNEDLEDGKRDDKDNGEDGNDGDNEVSDDGVNGDVDNGDTDGGNDGDDGDRDDGSDGDDKDNADNGDNGYSGDRDNEDDGDHTDDEVDGDDRDVETIETEMIEETMETEKTETIEMTEMETKRW